MPDIELPDTVPLYVTASEPSVPKSIVLPLIVPWIGAVPDGAERVMMPVRVELDCCQVSLKVPL